MRRLAERLSITPNFPNNPNAIQEYYIVEGISLGIANTVAAGAVIGPQQSQAAIADHIGGIIFRRAVAANSTDSSKARPLSIPKNEAAPAPNSNWIILCPECPVHQQTPAVGSATQTADGSAQTQPVPNTSEPKNKSKKWWKRIFGGNSTESPKNQPAEPPAFAYNIEYPCAATMAATMQQINLELAKRGLWADSTAKTKTVQIFVRPAAAAGK